MSKRSGPDKTTGGKVARPSKPWCDDFMKKAFGIFDISKGEHPVKWLVETLAYGSGILDALLTWFGEILPGVEKQEDLGSKAGKMRTVGLHQIVYKMPADGVPLFPYWKGLATDIYYCGFEPLREPLEVKVNEDGLLECVKGLGRLSILYFGAFWTFLKKDELTEEELNDFCRWLRTAVTFPCHVVQEQKESNYDWKRIQTSEQQALRERKSILQKAMVFARRANQLMVEESGIYSGEAGFRSAFLRGVEEYNNYGAAVSNPQLRVGHEAALELYGFKVGVANQVWLLIERHLHQFRWEQSAFSQQLLLEPRWLLGGTAKVPGAMWHEILTVTAAQQLLFMERILLLHSVSSRRAGSRSVVRLTQQEWINEVDVCCTLAWLMGEMAAAKTDDGCSLFTEDVIAAVQKRCIEGDFHFEMKEVLLEKDPTYKASFSTCWKENLKVVVVADDDRFKQCDQQLESLSKDARKAAFERDCLQLARDVATLGQLLEAEDRSERGKRTARVLHLKNQNTIGASIVKNYMDSVVSFKPGVPGEEMEVSAALEKMTKELEAKSGALLVWQDLTKLGKVTSKELDTATSVMALALRMMPTASAGFITCPVLVSAVANGMRDEMRRVEDKLDAKGLSNHLICLRMEVPPTSKKVALTYYGWLVFDAATETSNVFAGSQLYTDRSPRKLIPFAPETSYVVPTAERDALPHASEGMRSLSEFQETAQYLSGISFPEAILTALLGKTKLPSKVLGIVNCTPYDCWLERAAMKLADFLPGYKATSLSFGKNTAAVDFCAKTMALELIQAWKKGEHSMGNVRPYDPTPVDPPDDVKLGDFNFKLVSVEIGDPKKKGFNEKYKVKLPASIRSRYCDDVVFGSDWRELLKDFDSKFGTAGQMRPSLAPAAKPVEPELAPWTGEPANITQLQDRYLVEAKITGRLAGTTLFVVMAKDRSGKTDQVVEGQRLKLFLAAHVPVEIGSGDFLIAHGASRFLKAEKIMELKRKGKTGELGKTMICSWSSDEDEVVMEVQEAKSTVDTEKSTWKILLDEFEEEGHPDLHINGHDHHKATSETGEDRWMISPKATQIYYGWSEPTSINGVKYASVASIFNTAELENSRFLNRVWRICYMKEAKEFTPRKPLYFPKHMVTMSENEVIRVL